MVPFNNLFLILIHTFIVTRKEKKKKVASIRLATSFRKV